MWCLFKNYNGGDNSSAIATIKTEKILCINGELCLLCQSDTREDLVHESNSGN